MYEVRCSPENIAHRFVRHAETSPDSIAIICGDRTLSYGALFTSAKANAYQLKKRKPDGACTVAILGTRGIETPLAMISCLLADLPFVVIDIAYPLERILDILRISKATVGLCSASTALLNDEIFREKTHAVAWLTVDAPLDESIPDLEIESRSNETAYLLFTSGSTGFPKGIRTGHAPLIHFIDWYEKTFEPKNGSRFSMLSGLGHDPLLRDVFVPLSLGGELHIPKQEYLLAPDRLFDWIRSSRIQYAHLTPQLMDLLSARKDRKRYLDELRYVFCGGDVLRPATSQHVQEIAPNARLVNFYGTSETPQAMAYQIIGPELSAPYPIGKPISDVKISILDDDLHPMEIGQQGEIAVETEYLSLGYIGNPDGTADTKTRNAFLQRSAEDNNRVRMYLTGDVGYLDEEGRAYFCGRKDDQVKIRGYRVDCAEVAAAIERHGLTKRAVVLPEKSESGETILVAYVVGSDTELKQAITRVLPSYMVPGLIVGIDQLPLLPNGKVDRSTLRKIGQERIKAKAAVNSNSDSKFLRDVADVWGGIEFDTARSFVELGGDSLSYVRLSLLVEEHLGFLPEKWEGIPFEVLSEMAAPSPNVKGGAFSLVTIEPALLFRAISITFVVLDHARIGFFTATSTLFLVSGMSFARFLLPGLINSGRLYPTLSFITKFAVPAALWQLFRGGPEHHIWVPDIFLMGTLYANPVGGSLPFWFLDILAASLLTFAILATLAGLLGRFVIRTKRYVLSEFTICLGIFFIGLLAFFFQTQMDWWNGELNHTSVGPFRWFWLLPLGAAIQLAESISEKILLTAIGTALATMFYGNVVTAGFFAQPFSTFLFISIAALIWCSRVILPRILRGGVALLAQHSLFIYMFSGWVSNKLMPKLGMFGVPDWDSLRIILAFAFGITASIVWNEVVNRSFALFAALRNAPTPNQSRAKIAFLTIARVWRRD